MLLFRRLFLSGVLCLLLSPLALGQPQRSKVSTWRPANLVHYRHGDEHLRL